MRERILHQAARLLVAGGYDGISMREIAEGCGISKPALYYHFADKESLVLAVLESYLDTVNALVVDVSAGTTSGRERLEGILRGIFAQPPDQRALIRLGGQEMTQFSAEGRAHFGRLYMQKFIGPLAGVFEAGMEAGEFRGMSAHQAVWMFLGIMYPFFLPTARVEASQPPLEDLLAVFLDGMGKK
jgi:AcrR family transcriptional regulator